ncbi:MAG TPA: ATP-dependent DNA helicase [Aldersonia sp.]
MTDRIVSPAELADALGLPPPTAEQERVIAAPLGPTLVVAGAGAGKTETMASRVVWMVANRRVAPDEVLGLTFTRKAAQQLTSRIRVRLLRLAGSPLLRSLDPSGSLREQLSADPEISTYHSYAGRLLAEHGLLLPVEPAATLLSPTQHWQLAYRVVAGWDGDLDTERTPATLTEAVLALAGQLAEHLVEPADLREAHTELDKLVHTLPAGPRQRGGPAKALTDILDVQTQRVDLLPLVDRLAETMRRGGMLDFGSQMSLAARLAEEHPEVGAAERQRFRLVLLDEYQDTGHAQRVLLSGLFGGAVDRRLAVTAVGDPMQSIYGWRGASAANLPRFATDFPRGPGKPAPVLPLMTSWRNPPEALALANHVADPLRDGTVEVEPLRPRPRADAGTIAIATLDTVADERNWVAERIAAEYAAAADAGSKTPTAAVLLRRNADAAPIAEALRAHGLPVEIVGLGGLLSTPEVGDIVAVLRMLADPAAGGAAVRILTGARWQLGIADLLALWERARVLSVGAPVLDAEITDAAALRDALGRAVPLDGAEHASLTDAIADPGSPEHYSRTGYGRIVALGKELAALRARLGQPLPELVADVERTIGIGVEAQARRPGASGGREHLDAFADVVAGYASDPGASIGALLAFLTAAESVEGGLEPGEVEVAPDRVQVLTVHAAKGLEWQVVAVPHVVSSVFPSTTASGTWLGALAELPPTLRGDRALTGEVGGVPVLDLDGVGDRAQLGDAVDAHKKALARRRLDEERRLFYVALTRTERVLLVSGHQWGETGEKPKGPSELLLELHHSIDADPSLGVVVHWAPTPQGGAGNPLTEAPVSAQWPVDPLGARHAGVAAGAAAVRAALAEPDTEPADSEPADTDEWAADVEALLAERARGHSDWDVHLPTQLSVTQLVELRADPVRLAQRLRRPLPFKPNPLARRGTAFHAWVERRFGATRLLDLDELPGAADSGASADADLAALQEAFLASAWANRSPAEVEVAFETAVGGTVVRGRMDAVFAEPDGGWTVVDWKTGAEPTPAEEAAVAVQLAVYRLAWARLIAARTGDHESNVLARVNAAFHYVRSGRTVAPAALPDEATLAALLEPAEVRADAGPDGSPPTPA